MTINVLCPTCPRCGNKAIIEVDLDGYMRWVGGEHVQAAFPTLDANHRELLMTGIHPACWDEMFSEEEEDS